MSSVRALQAVLPPDIGSGRCAGWRPASSRATRAQRREYRYPSGTGRPARSASATRSACASRWTSAAMAGAAQALVGRHDFSAFGGRDRQPIRTLDRVGSAGRVALVTIDVVGDAFLRQMVRSIVAALLRVGHGQATAAEVAAALAAAETGVRRRDRRRHMDCAWPG